MSGTLTQEQIRRIEENKRKALAKRALKASSGQNGPASTSGTVTTSIQKTVDNSRNESHSASISKGSLYKDHAVEISAFGQFGNEVFSTHSSSGNKLVLNVAENNRINTQNAKPEDTSKTRLQAAGTTLINATDKIEQKRQKALALRAERLNKSPSKPDVVAATTCPSVYKSGSLDIKTNSEKTNCSFKTTGVVLGKPAETISGYHDHNPIQKSSDKPSNSSGIHNSREQSTSVAANAWNAFGGLMQGNVKGSCVLVSRDRFEVQVGYCAPLIELFKTMETKLYDAVTKKWTFKLSEYQKFMSAVKVFKPSVDIEPLPRAILQAFSAQLRGENADRDIPMANLSKVDPVLVNSLMSFQRTGVNFGVYKNGRVLIADDMGLGKTIQAICLACYYRSDWPVLVVVPSSVRYDWAQQFRRWVPSVDPQAINVVATGKDSCTEGLVNIVSYDLMARRAEELKHKGFRVVIMTLMRQLLQELSHLGLHYLQDESHLLKNYKTARCKAADPILRHAKRVILLSGTPALSRPSELYTQISAVCPFILKFHDFGVRYCDGKQMQWGWDFSGSSNMSELQLLLGETVMIRRLKKEVLAELPDKVRHMVMLDPGSIKISKELKSASKVMSTAKLKNSEQRGALLEFFHKSGSAKLKAIKNYVEDLLEQEKKFLIFAHHADVMDGIEDTIRAKLKENKYIRIDGKTSSEQRNIFCGKFQTKETIRAAILSITAANAGLNLSAANLVVFAELFWNPGILVQAEDRAHRIGQQDSVSVQYLVATGTSDDTIWPMIQRKLDVLGKAGLTKDNFSSAETTRLKDQQQLEIEQFLEESFSEDLNLPEDKQEEEFKPASPSKVPKQASILKFTSPMKIDAGQIPVTPPKETNHRGLFKYFSPSKKTANNPDANQNVEKLETCANTLKPGAYRQSTDGESLEELEQFLDDSDWLGEEVSVPPVKKRKVEPFKPSYAKGKS